MVTDLIFWFESCKRPDSFNQKTLLQIVFVFVSTSRAQVLSVVAIFLALVSLWTFSDANIPIVKSSFFSMTEIFNSLLDQTHVYRRSCERSRPGLSQLGC